MDEKIKQLGLLLILGFLAILSIPVLQMQFHFFPEPENMENRELAQKPTGDCSSLAEYAEGWERYFADNFGFRPYLIRWNSILKLNLLNVSPVPSVILGKDSWLFYCSEALADGNTVNDFRGTIPLTQRELVKLQRRLEANQHTFARRNIVYLVAIVPNKNTIYSEYLPDNIRKFRDTTRLDQLLAHMREHSPVKILDLREAIFKAKSEYPVYWKSDSHWNSYGAYIGYVEIMRQMSAYLPSLPVVPIEGDKVMIERSPSGGDLAQMLFLQDAWAEENNTKFNLDNGHSKPQMGTLIFRHDSFGDALYPFLRCSFNKLINIAPFAQYRLEAIFEQRPLAVLHIFAERYITQAIHDDFYYEEASRN
jgi:alginate O-acetyltransferase complex protein AlgJ